MSLELTVVAVLAHNSALGANPYIILVDKLNGTNFVDWFRFLRVVLKHEKKLFLKAPPPNTPARNASAEVRSAYDKHLNDSLDVSCLMLASMTPELLREHEDMNAWDMISSLKSMFQLQARKERFDAIRALHACKMTESLSVSTHVLRMKGYVDRLTRLGYPLGQELATDMVLNSLSKSYDQFVLNYNINGLEKTLTELHGMLKTAERNMKSKLDLSKPKQVLMIKPKGGINKKKGVVTKGNRKVGSSNKEKSKGKIPEEAGLRSEEKMKPDQMELQMENGAKVAAIAQGTYDMKLPNGLILALSKSKLQADRVLESCDDSYDVCESCLMGKMTKAPFKGKPERATELLGVIHIDVCGPFSSTTRNGHRYFITFTDDFSRYGYVYLMKNKSESFELFKEFQNEVENQHGKKLKTLRSDRGQEYLSQEFIDHLRDNGIVSQLTPPGTLQHNGVSERRNRTLLDMVRSMMSHTNLPKSFWGYALETATRILNDAPTKKTDKTPFELWTGKIPKLSYMRI
ncbi:hypothetical protein L6452_38568 [Arctium lappa]|uniref:Uncharacterized protein n=1 Tax=Arctium lappa TaxID=4217 RepID=A0ACB8XQ46_ARCLA|nr:hypothetical protein L6452_38568 [Arctium lappa]